MRSIAAEAQRASAEAGHWPVGLPTLARALLHGLVLAGWLFLAWLVLTWPLGTDAYAYWAVNLEHPYEGTYGGLGFFPYSPAAALFAAPLGLLPWPIFLVAWTALALGCLIWLTGARWPLFLALPFVGVELVLGNITLLIAVAIVVGFRWPAAWAFILLTKVTPGVGLLWFAVRREWRSLTIALAVTATVAALSFLILPTQWTEWLQVLVAGAPEGKATPLLPRLPVAAVLVIWGALTNRPWTVAVAATLALPRFGFPELSLLVAAYALRREDVKAAVLGNTGESQRRA